MAYSEDVNINLNVLAGAMGGITAIMGGMSALTSTFGQFGTEAVDNFGAVDGLLVSATALIASFGAQAAQAFGEFEQGMKIVQTVSGQAQYSIQQLGTQANQLSLQYRVAIGDITEGLQTLGRAGLNSASEQLEVLESGLQTAKLEGRNLNGVLEELIQNTAMLGGDLKSSSFGEDTAYLNSLMVGTSMTAPIDSHDISQTMQYAGGTAAAAGANLQDKEKLEDLMGTVAAFAQKGVKGSMAGTALRAFFTKPASQDESVTDALGTLGLSPEDLWEDGGNSMKSVSDQIGIIQRHMDALNLSTMEQVEIWGKIVGPKMGQQMMKLDSSSIKELTTDIQSAQSAEDLAAKTLQTYNQKLSQMQQAGELVFRGLGEKAVIFLTPVVDAINLILDALSNPVVNTAVFATIGGLVYHGIRKASGMIKSLFSQISGLLGNTTGEVERLNTLAGGSASGFEKSTLAVDMLNAKLAESNTELAALQAQFMKIQAVSNTGTFVAPLGLVNSQGQLPRGMISTANQNVHVGNGVIGAKGAFYDPSDVKKLEEEYRKSITQANIESNKNLDRFYSKSISTDSRGQTHYMNPDSKSPTQFISKDEWKKLEKEKLAANPVVATKDLDKNIAKSIESGSKQIHSSMVSMTEKEYNKWMAGLKNSSDPLKKFNYQRQKELEKHAGSKISNTVDGQKFFRTVQFAPIQKRFNEYERLLQKEGQFIQFEQKRAALISQQQALAQGKSTGFLAQQKQNAIGLGQKGSDFFNRRLQQYSNALNSSIVSIRRWAGILDTSSEAALVKVNQAITVVEEEMQTGSMTFEQALAKLAEETNFNATELHSLLTASTELNAGFGTLNDRLISLGLTTAEGELATAENTTAILANTVEEEANTSAKLMGGLKSGLSSIAGFMGGPFMVAMMGGMVAMQAIQHAQQDWQKKMQEVTERMGKAIEKQDSMGEKIKEQYSKETGDNTELGAERALISAYADIYDASRNQSIELDENTAELMRNTEAVKASVDAANDITSDRVFGQGQWGSELSDRMGTLSVWASDYFSDVFDIAIGNVRDSERSWFNVNANPSGSSDFFGADRWLFTDGFERTSGQGYFDNDNIVLTAAQADDNYPWLKEFTPILSADIWELGIEGGLKQAFGGDFNKITDILESTTSQKGMDAWNSSAFGINAQNINREFKDAKSQNRLQYALKNYQSDFQNLGYQTRLFEKASGGKSAYSVFMKGKGGSALQDEKGYKKLTKAGDKNTKQLINYIKGLSIKTGMTEQQVLLAAQLQQMQDMQNIANEVVAPNMLMQTQQAISMAQYSAGINSHMPGSESGALTAGENARAIAALLNVQMEGTLQEGLQRGITEDTTLFSDAERQKYAGMSPAELYAAGIAADPNSALGKAFTKYYIEPYATTNSLLYGADRSYAEKAGKDWAELNKDSSNKAKIDTLRGGANEALGRQIEAAYDQKAIEANTPKNDKGSGGGSGDGSDKDKSNTGSTKSRVDLVLCSKKTIPKLNVNLFKKAPNFTILNKNFKLRDIKINSQDKPDAITDAIKNGIIETQKRMDPKIIQSEESVYDPVTSTDGTSIPSGNTPVSSK